jgi:hypothetical protein
MEKYEKIQATHLVGLREKVSGLMCLMKTHPLKIDYSAVSAVGYVPGEHYIRANVSLVMAKAWMGKCLEAIGKESPNKNNGRREELDDIEESSDCIEVVDAIIKQYPDTKYPLSRAFITVDDALARKEDGFVYFSGLSYVQKTDWLREQIQKVKVDFLSMPPITGPKARICVQNVYTHLTEARMNLGLQLKEFKEFNKHTQVLRIFE